MERRFTKHVFMTAWRRMSLTLLVALCCYTAASAETLTVYDGTDDSQYLPVYGYWADVSDTKSEFVIPKGELSDMEDGTISALTFYLQQSASAAWTATFQVYLKEIDATTLTGITGPDASTVVYTGTLDARGTEMTVTFSTPYTYNGGNLLIGTYNSVKSSNSPSAYFYGVNQSENTGWYRTSSTKFIPKTTFTYEPSGSAVPKPNNLAASNITHEKATITWSSDQSAWDIAWSTDPDFDPASATTHTDNVSEKTYTITGLSQSTDYYVAVQNAGSGKWSSTLHFKTAAIATAVGDGWSENFESPGGWDLINGELANKWTWGTAANNGGTHALYISNDGGTTNAYTFITSNTIVYATRLLTFTEGTFEFSYDWRANGESSSDYLRVALVPATESLTAGTTVPTGFSASALPTGWIALDGGSQLSGVTAWQHKDATIDVAAGNYYLVFAWRNDGGAGNNPPAAIDNVSISKYTDKVTDLAVSNITTTAATISWNGNGDSYNVRYTKLFLTEGFEGGSMPAGWTKEGTGLFSIGTGDNETDRGSHSGNKNARFPSSSSNIGNQTYLITPSMDLSGETSLKLSFWYINRAAVSHIDGIGVYYRVGTEGEWNELWSTTEAHGSWTNQEVTLTGLAANYQLGFKMTNNDGYGVGLDDIQITTSADWQTVNDITTMSTTLTGLDANTTYGCQVQSVKAGKTSFWSPIATFTTMQLKDIATCDITVPNQTMERFGGGDPYPYIYFKFEDAEYNPTSNVIGEVVTDGEKTLTLGTDYKFGMITFDGPSTHEEKINPCKPGDKCLVEIVGIGDYGGSKWVSFKITYPDANGTWGDLTWAFHDGTLTITGTGAMNATTADKYPWRSIARYVETINIGDNITTIANGAFEGTAQENPYSSVTTVSLPSTLTTIGDNAFAFCTGATITIPTSVTTLGANPFNQVRCVEISKPLEDGNDNSDIISKMSYAQSATFTYKRSFTENVASTVCLPFDYTPQEGEGKYYTFTAIDKTTSPWTVTMTTNTVASLTANTPYMFMPVGINGEVTFTGTASSFDPSNVEVNDPVVTGGKWNLIGTYESRLWNDTHNTEEIGSVYGFAAQSHDGGSYTVNPGDFVKAMAGASIAPFRAYLKYTAPVSNAPRRGAAEEALPSRMSVRLVNADGDVTAIGTIDTKTGEIRFDSEAWYTLDGRRLDSKPAQKGVYINNGKKIIVK